MDRYILDGKEPIPETSPLKWARWLETANKIVKQTEVAKGVMVSTVFLGFDHSFGGPTPILFETMIFGGSRDSQTERYPTWDEAVAGHDRIVDEFFHRCPYCGTLRTADEIKCIYCGGSF